MEQRDEMGGKRYRGDEKKNGRRWATVRRRTAVPAVAGGGVRWSGLVAVVEGRRVKWEEDESGA